MNEKDRRRIERKKLIRYITWVVLGSALIVVFAMWGIGPSRFGDNQSGVAVTVNDAAISLAEYRNELERREQNLRLRLDQFPEEQKKMFQKQLHQQALSDVVRNEAVFQAAEAHGVTATDAEVRDYILQFPFLQDNGRFMKERYHAFLQNQNMSTEDFERRVRKEIVRVKLQELFIGSAAPTLEEQKRDRILAGQKVDIRFVDIKRDDLPKLASDAEIDAYLKAHAADVETYYKNNPTEFTHKEKVHAYHILIRADEKRPAAEALKMASELRAKVTAKNFAQLAAKNSDDPGSKSKGGDLGEFEKGRMMPEFENAAFSLKPGEISQPVKTTFGYHIIYVDKKTGGGTDPLEKVKSEIARKLIARSNEAQLVAKARAAVEKGGKKDVDALVQKAGLKWEDSGEFALSAPAVPKLGDNKEVVEAVMKHGKSPGLIPELIPGREGSYAIVDLASWKEAPEAPPAPDSASADRMAAYRKSSDLIEAWEQQAMNQATVVPNPRILQQ